MMQHYEGEHDDCPIDVPHDHAYVLDDKWLGHNFDTCTGYKLNDPEKCDCGFYAGDYVKFPLAVWVDIETGTYGNPQSLRLCWIKDQTTLDRFEEEGGDALRIVFANMTGTELEIDE